MLRFLLLFSLWGALACTGFATEPPAVINGTLDLRQWDVASGKPVALDGDWSFFPSSFPEANGQLSAQAQAGELRVHVPGFWADNRNTALTAKGYGTYKLEILLPPDCPPISIKLGTVWSAWKAWANGTEIGSVGQLGQTAESSVAVQRSAMLDLPNNAAKVELLIAVSCFEHHRGGGIGKGLFLAEHRSAVAQWKRSSLLHSISAAFLLMAVLYHLILFFYYRAERSYLYFGILVLAGFFRQISTGELLIAEFANTLPFEVLHRFRYVGFMLSAGYGVMYARSLTRAVFPAWLANTALYAAWICTAFVLVAPTYISSYALLPFMIFSLLVGVYAGIVLLGAYRHYEVEVRYLLIGAVIALAVFVHDLLADYMGLNDRSWLVAGFPLFVLSQVIMLAIRNRRFRNQAGALSDELKQANVKLSAYNRDLEKKVAERTREVVEQKEMIEHQNTRLQELNEFKTNFTSMLVHDLKNPINVILNSETGKQDEAVQRSGMQMLQLVSNLLDLNKYEESQLVLSLADRNVREVLHRAVSNMEVFANEKSVKLVLEVDPGTTVYADAELIGRVADNMLSNAIKFSPFGSEVRIRATAAGADLVQIEVIDSGSGIAKENQALVFEKNTSLERSRVGHFRATGLGLAFCKMVIEAHNGEIGVESELGKGATFWFRIAGKFDSFSQARQQKEQEEAADSQANALTADELSALRPIAEQIAPLPVYRATQIVDILNQLPDSSQAVADWKKQVQNALFNSDKAHLEKVLELVLKG